MNNLNIYKVSGVAKVGYNDRVRIWLAGTNDLENTRAVNYVLSELNLLNTKQAYTRDTAKRIEYMNQIDVYTLLLESLFVAKESEAISVESVGKVISNMVLNNMFDSVTDDIVIRTNNLDALIVDFQNRINSVPVNLETDPEFDAWYKMMIVDENYNNTSEGVINNYNSYLEKVGASDTSQTIAQKTSDAGPCFLYMFMTDKQIGACNDIIQKRYNQELQNWEWETRICRGAYTTETIRNLYETGCTLHYNMTPEDKIAELFEYNEANGGVKIGTPLWFYIISAVVAVIGVLISLYDVIKDIYKLTYEADDDYKTGVPDQDADGWNMGDAVKNAKDGGSLTDPDPTKDSTSKSNALLLIGVAALGILMLM